MKRLTVKFRTDIQDAIAAPITDAVSDVVGGIMTNILITMGLLAA